MQSSEYDLFTNSVSLDSLVSIKSARFFRGDYLEGYQAFNASLLSKEGKLKCLIRNSSFAVGNISKNRHLGQESYISQTEIIGTKMSRPIKIDIDGIKSRTPFEYNGLEDPRYFMWKGKEYALCVQPNDQITGSWMVLVDLETKTFVRLFDYLDRKWNKNWVPYVKNDELFLISDIFPTIVYKIEDDSMNLIHHTEAQPVNFVIHGSSNIFDYKGIKTALVHGRISIPTSDPDKSFWFYWHAFIQWPEDNWEKIKFGRPFFFENRQIEFCTSVIEHDENILITYSANDWGINIIEIGYEELEKIL
jgi:predicted GH43/DUF377 family glycosyl hydrolase